MAQTILNRDAQGFKVGDYTPFNNVWGKGDLVNGVDYTQSVTFTNGTVNGGVTFNWSWPTGGYNVVAYPEIVWGDSPLYNGADETHTYVSKISDLTAFDVQLDITTSVGAQYWNVSFDVWLTDKPLGDASSITTELMVWLDKTATPWGTKVATIGSGNDTASVYFVNDVKSGTRVWDYLSVVYDKKHLSGEVDLKAILEQLAAKGLVDDDNYVSGYNIGAEIRGGSGSLSINKLETDFRSDPTGLASKSLVGTIGDDILKGGAGDDTFEGGAGKDNMDGGKGIDTLKYTTSNAGVTIDIQANTASGGHATGDTISNFENLTGSAYNDTLFGNTGANIIDGGNGNDVIDGRAGDDFIYGGAGGDLLKGGEGKDTIFGEAGNDRIIGGAGADDLKGGLGGDWFVYTNGDSTLTKMDHIFGFNFAEGDRLDFVNVDGDTVTRGYQRFDFIGSKAFSGHAGEIRYEKTSTETFIYADTDGNKVADLAIALDHAVVVDSGYFLM